jgi:membrane-associated HD superfamily phosphohydrolase
LIFNVDWRTEYASLAATVRAAAALKLQKEDFDAVQVDYQKMMKRISDLKIKYPNNSSLTGIEEKMRNLPIVLGKDLNTAKYNIASVNKSLDISEKVWAATQKTTISCIKGKAVKKVTGINPKCPAGYKKNI